MYKQTLSKQNGCNTRLYSIGAEDRNRTCDLLVTNQLLYRLSHFSMFITKSIIPNSIYNYKCFKRNFSLNLSNTFLHKQKTLLEIEKCLSVLIKIFFKSSCSVSYNFCRCGKVYSFKSVRNFSELMSMIKNHRTVLCKSSFSFLTRHIVCAEVEEH